MLKRTWVRSWMECSPARSRTLCHSTIHHSPVLFEKEQAHYCISQSALCLFPWKHFTTVWW